MKLARMFFLTLANIAVLGALAGPAHADNYSFEGDGGFQKSFPLIGGEYDLYVIAKYPIRGYYSAGSRSCSFAGMLERTSPTYDSWSLGTYISRSSDDVIPWKIDQVLTLSAGQYELYITSVTDCKWIVTLVLNKPQTASPPGTNPNGNAGAPSKRIHCCILGITMVVPILGAVIPTKTTSVALPARFEAVIFGTDEQSPYLGTYKIMHGETLVLEGMLMSGLSQDTRNFVYFVDVRWGRGSTKYLGKNTIEFTTWQGSSSLEFTLTK